MAHNGFFHWWDPTVTEMAGFVLPSDWWSRPYEYAWAIEYAQINDVVADMGCGWMYRPFKDALSDKCAYVYAVDADERLLRQNEALHTEFVTADITKRIDRLEDESLDTVFCISVLEDLNEMVGPALKEFRRCIRDDGQIVMTFDVPYDTSRPTPVYPGLPLEKFELACQDAGLRYAGEVDYDKDQAINHREWNLCVFHCVLVKA